MSNEMLTAEPGLSTNEMLMAKRVAEKLHTTYPGHLWAVDVQGSLINVRDLYLSGLWGFTLSIPSIYSSSELDRQVVLAGGELLERFKQRRGAVDAASINSLPVGFDGHHKPEL